MATGFDFEVFSYKLAAHPEKSGSYAIEIRRLDATELVVGYVRGMYAPIQEYKRPASAENRIKVEREEWRVQTGATGPGPAVVTNNRYQGRMVRRPVGDS